MQARIDGDFKQRFVQIVKELLKAADDVIQFVYITAQQHHIRLQQTIIHYELVTTVSVTYHE